QRLDLDGDESHARGGRKRGGFAVCDHGGALHHPPREIQCAGAGGGARAEGHPGGGGGGGGGPGQGGRRGRGGGGGGEGGSGGGVVGVKGSVAPNDSGLTSTATSLTRAVGENVVGSPYAITAGSFTTPSTNYSAPTLVAGSSLTITPAALTATVANQTKVYGADDPALGTEGVTLGGLITNPAVVTWNGNVAINDSGLTSTATSLTRAVGENVVGSPYAFPTRRSSDLSTNYSAPTLVAGSSLTITPAALTATVANQ